MTIAFAGTADFGADMLRALIDGSSDGHSPREVALVLSQPDRPAGRGKRLVAPPVAQLARERGLRLVQPTALHTPDLLELYRELGITVFVVAAFGQMVREPILSDFLCLNVHGSQLPKWRGAAPIERAIMAGDQQTGVDIMRMEEGLDTGPIARRGVVPIGRDDDAGTIFSALAECGGALLHEAIDAFDAGTLTFTPQPDLGATYAHKITADDRRIDVRHTAQHVHDQVRALSPHIGAWLNIDDQRVGIWRTSVCDEAFPSADRRVGAIWHDASRMLIATGDDTLIDVHEVQPAGKRRMAVGDWLRGLRSPLTAVQVGDAS